MKELRCVVPAHSTLSASYGLLVHRLMILIRFAHPSGSLRLSIFRYTPVPITCVAGCATLRAAWRLAVYASLRLPRSVTLTQLASGSSFHLYDVHFINRGLEPLLD